MLAFPGHALTSILIFSVYRYNAEVENKNAPGSQSKWHGFDLGTERHAMSRRLPFKQYSV